MLSISISSASDTPVGKRRNSYLKSLTDSGTEKRGVYTLFHRLDNQPMV
jgi:hypothetical protein